MAVNQTIILVALAAVTLVLVLGLWNLMKDGSKNRSQQLMRWRIGLQFIAIVIALGFLALAQTSG